MKTATPMTDKRVQELAMEAREAADASQAKAARYVRKFVQASLDEQVVVKRSPMRLGRFLSSIRRIFAVPHR